MEENRVRCKDCGENVTPEFGLCPTCNYEFRLVDYQQSGVREEDFTGQRVMDKSELPKAIKFVALAVIVCVALFAFLSK